MSVKIIVDSTVDLTEDVLSKVRMVPLTVNFGETEYTDRVDINYNKMKLIERTDCVDTNEHLG